MTPELLTALSHHAFAVDFSAVLAAGCCAVTLIQAVWALSECRRRASDWPLWRCGPAVFGVVLHDVAVGLAVVFLLGATPWGIGAALPGGAWHGAVARVGSGGAIAGVAISVLFALGGALQPDRITLTGPTWLRLMRIKRAATDDTLRERGLARVARTASRASNRWVRRQADRLVVERTPAAEELLRNDLRAASRLVLQESMGPDHPGFVVEAQQVDRVLDDEPSSVAERLYALLELVYLRAGRRGVRALIHDVERRARGRRPTMPGAGPSVIVLPEARQRWR